MHLLLLTMPLLLVASSIPQKDLSISLALLHSELKRREHCKVGPAQATACGHLMSRLKHSTILSEEFIAIRGHYFSVNYIISKWSCAIIENCDWISLFQLDDVCSNPFANCIGVQTSWDISSDQHCDGLTSLGWPSRSRKAGAHWELKQNALQWPPP